jgi:hypothetical protein
MTEKTEQVARIPVKARIAIHRSVATTEGLLLMPTSYV